MTSLLTSTELSYATVSVGPQRGIACLTIMAGMLQLFLEHPPGTLGSQFTGLHSFEEPYRSAI